MNKRAFTLIELIVASILLSIAILGISQASLFFINQIGANIERQSIYSQMNYALEDMKLRAMSASRPSTTLPPDGSSSVLEFVGERDIYNITPDELTDNVCYRYFIDKTSGENKGLKLITCNTCPCDSASATSTDMLLDGKFNPDITFKHTVGDEPNFITVTISATAKKSSIGLSNNIAKSDGLRFWFIYIVE